MAKTPIQMRDLADEVTLSSPDFVDLSSKVACPNTSISNRGLMVDLNNDLKVCAGIERIMCQEIALCPEEYGPSGQQVWKLCDDVMDRIRFVGAWFRQTDGNGLFLDQRGGYASTTDYVEITFFGTGINLLMSYGQGASNYTYQLDGGSPVSFFTSAQTSVFLSFSQNYIYPVISGLSRQVHTLRINKVVNNELTISGIEIMNETTTLHINPGSALIAGQRVVNPIPRTSAYNSGFTNSYGTAGSRGGRVLVYMDSTGAIKKDIQYVDTTQKVLNNTDHSNEELIRVYNIRQFGTANTPAFDCLVSRSGSESVVGYTLDDNATAFSGVTVDTASTTGIVPATTNSYLYFTFVGTGLDFIRQDQNSNAIDPHDLLIDGTLVGSFSGGSSEIRLQKVVSGLKYGTHTCVILRNNNASNGVGAFKWLVYGPKTPALPSGSLALGSYNILPTYVANTVASPLNVAQGVVRKHCSRELVFAGTGWSLQWVGAPIVVNGYRLISGDNGTSLRFHFMGTGMEWRQDTFPSDSNAINLALDNATLSTANYTITLNGGSPAGTGPAVSVTTYGGPTFDPSTGTLSLDAASATGTAITISGLSYGLHELSVLNSAAATMMVHSFDVAVPFYAPVQQKEMTINNYNEIGNNSIADERAFHPLLSEHSATTRNATGVMMVPYSIGSTGSVFFPSPLHCVLNAKKSRARYKFSMMFRSDNAGNNIGWAVYVNGFRAAVGNNDNIITAPLTTGWIQATESDVVGVNPGLNLIQVWFYSSGGTTLMSSGKITVEEID